MRRDLEVTTGRNLRLYVIVNIHFIIITSSITLYYQFSIPNSDETSLTIGKDIVTLLKLRCPITLASVQILPLLLKYSDLSVPFIRGTKSGNLIGSAPLTRTGINKGFERMDATSGSKRSSYTKSNGALKRARITEAPDMNLVPQSAPKAFGKCFQLLVV